MSEEEKQTLIGGFIRRDSDGGPLRPVKVEVPHPTELMPSDGFAPQRLQEAAERAEKRKRGRPPGAKNQFPRDPSVARARKTALACMGVSKDTLTGVNKTFANAVRCAQAWRRSRTREMIKHHGYVSSGVGSLLASAALALASSRYLYDQAAQTTDAKEAKEFMAGGAKMADSARQNELAAWELCARESVSSKKAEAHSQGVPWLVPQQDRKQLGRPTREQERAKQEVITVMPEPIGQEQYRPGVDGPTGFLPGEDWTKKPE